MELTKNVIFTKEVTAADPIGVQIGYLTNFDYMCGVIQLPKATEYTYKAEQDPPTYKDTLHSYSFVPTRQSLLTNTHIIKQYGYAGDSVMESSINMTSQAEMINYFGRNVDVVATNKLVLPYTDDNVMDDIIIDFSRKINGNNVQSFHVTGSIRLKYVIEVKVNLKRRRNPKREDDKPRTYGGVSLTGYGNRIPNYISSMDKSRQLVNDIREQKYDKNSYVKIYTPCYYPTLKEGVK